MSAKGAPSRRGQKTLRKQRRQEASTPATESPPSTTSNTQHPPDKKSTSEPSTPITAPSTSSKQAPAPISTQPPFVIKSSSTPSTTLQPSLDISASVSDGILFSHVYEPKLENNEKIFANLRHLMNRAPADLKKLLDDLNVEPSDVQRDQRTEGEEDNTVERVAPEPTRDADLPPLEPSHKNQEATPQPQKLTPDLNPSPSDNKGPNRKERREHSRKDRMTVLLWKQMSNSERAAYKSHRRLEKEEVVLRGEKESRSTLPRPANDSGLHTKATRMLSTEALKDRTIVQEKTKKDNIEDAKDDDSLSVVSHVVASDALAMLEGRLLSVLSETREEYRKAMNDLNSQLLFMSQEISVINAAQQEHAAKINDIAKPNPFGEATKSDEENDSSDSEVTSDDSSEDDLDDVSSVSLPSNIDADSDSISESMPSLSSDTDSDSGIGVESLPSRRDKRAPSKPSKKDKKKSTKDRRKQRIRTPTRQGNTRPSEAFVGTLCGYRKEFLVYIKQHYPRYLERANNAKSTDERKALLLKLIRK
eukprot:GHVN01055541.1.p1 GENE.GHVN01055541.1~~GHVN01055541.1.p1  ORF type:complete len:533 (+),score=94.97 GHVN01055541.1:1672-3270(+)